MRLLPPMPELKTRLFRMAVPIALVLIAVAILCIGLNGRFPSVRFASAGGRPAHLSNTWDILSTTSITPTSEWVNFHSQNTALQGQPVPVGAVVRAYNPRGVQCGEFTVEQAGWYGLMPVYRDNPNTPEDEGMLPGEAVSFTINDLPARPMGPDDTIWTTNGAVKQVNLAASTLTPTNEWVNFHSQNTLLEGQPVPIGAVVRAYNPRGILCGEYVVDHAGWYGTMPVYRDDPNTPADEGMLPDEKVFFAIDGVPARILGPDDAIWTENGDLKEVDLSASLDTDPPVISDVAAGNITGSGATITWTTDEPASSQVEYGLTTEYGSLTPFDPYLVTSHSVTLSGLADSTTYHYRVRSKDASANLAVSEDHTFTTADTTPPDTSIVAGPSGTVPANTVSFQWEGVDNLSPTEDLLYSYRMDWGSWSSYTAITSTVFSDLYDGGHTFYVRAKDQAGNVDPSSASRGFTVDTTSPAFYNIQAVDIHSSGATITWDSNELADSQIEYGLTSSYGFSTTLDTDLTTSHSAVITGLDILTTYHYRVRSADGVGNLAISGDHTFTTHDTTPPETTIVSGPTGTIPSTSVIFQWTGEDDVSTVPDLLYSYRMDDAAWSSYSGATSQEFTSLSEGDHTVQVRAKDEAGNIDPTPATRTFSVDTIPPLISDVNPTNVTASGATITWDTDELADSQVEYGPTTSYGSSTTLDLNLVTDHSVNLSDLTESSTYHYRVRSRDAVGNLALSADYTLYIWPTAPITPTSEWVNFYSQNSTRSGQPLPVGTTIRAYNPRGVQCGHFVINQTGWYGLVPVYRDNPNTPADEGMLPDETVVFIIDDILARPQGPDDAIWTNNGAIKQVDLSATEVTPTNEWVSFYSQNSPLDGQPMPIGAVVRAYNPRGVQCGEFIVNHAGWYGTMSVYRDDPETGADEGMLPGEEVAFTINDLPAAVLGPDDAVWTTNGDLKQVDLSATSAPCYDFDNSGQVDIADVMRVASRWRTSCEIPDPDNDPETPNYEARYDVKEDCIINVVDIMLVVAHWGETCP